MYKTCAKIEILISSKRLRLDRIESMRVLNGNGIAVTHRNGEDFVGNVDLNDVLTISLHSPLLGIIVDWSCNENVLFKVLWTTYSI